MVPQPTIANLTLSMDNHHGRMLDGPERAGRRIAFDATRRHTQVVSECDQKLAALFAAPSTSEPVTAAGH